MKYKNCFLWFLLVSYIISWVDLSISWLNSSTMKAVSKMKDKEGYLLIAKYELTWVYFYYVSMFFLYLSLVLTVPYVTKQKKDLLFSISMLFIIHLSEDMFFWLNAIIIGFYHFGDPVWYPNYLLPIQLQWLNLSLFRIYIIDSVCIVFSFLLWYYYTTTQVSSVKDSSLADEIGRKFDEITTLNLKMPTDDKILQEILKRFN